MRGRSSLPLPGMQNPRTPPTSTTLGAHKNITVHSPSQQPIQPSLLPRLSHSRKLSVVSFRETVHRRRRSEQLDDVTASMRLLTALRGNLRFAQEDILHQFPRSQADTPPEYSRLGYRRKQWIGGVASTRSRHLPPWDQVPDAWY